MSSSQDSRKERRKFRKKIKRWEETRGKDPLFMLSQRGKVGQRVAELFSEVEFLTKKGDTKDGT